MGRGRKREREPEILKQLEAEGKTLEATAVRAILEAMSRVFKKNPMLLDKRDELLTAFVEAFDDKLVELGKQDELVTKLEPVVEKVVGRLIEKEFGKRVEELEEKLEKLEKEVKEEAEKTRNEVIGKVVEGINALDEGVWRVGQQNLIIQSKIDDMRKATQEKFSDLKEYLGDLNWSNQRAGW